MVTSIKSLQLPQDLCDWMVMRSGLEREKLPLEQFLKSSVEIRLKYKQEETRITAAHVRAPLP